MSIDLYLCFIIDVHTQVKPAAQVSTSRAAERPDGREGGGSGAAGGGSSGAGMAARETAAASAVGLAAVPGEITSRRIEPWPADTDDEEPPAALDDEGAQEVDSSDDESKTQNGLSPCKGISAHCSV